MGSKPDRDRPAGADAAPIASHRPLAGGRHGGVVGVDRDHLSRIFFWQINPAAPLFAALALLAAALFAWLGVIKNRLRIVTGMPCRRALGLAVAMFAVAIYPALGGLSGHTYPATPTFGLPCPVTIFTFGVTHMASNDLPKGLLLVPLLWAVIGSMAAWTLGVVQDFTLVVVAVLGTCQLFRTRRARHNP